MATATADFDVRRNDSLGLRIQHVLHANPVLGPLAVLVIAIIAFNVWPQFSAAAIIPRYEAFYRQVYLSGVMQIDGSAI